ncbi:tRNA nucleotidyltransferase/poly(A) polymerase [Halobacteroides halobius DSM 5150]|uniref:tRNA nucleotidyltransferase/poly(A) polymerase n=1 Tax=Halobacteroides halobius (strain ATCC 35273 / DSM 5150 / MD-1) TaxID=748449 RepID=L0K888_HALHC|nr:CBS domain-containing protein [Halobacteroides halobius]AGB40579.1 tRNA nucleotidyltransferase/poly(A) polymerase [Halobacteroides halobius DSM 5150]
MEIITTHQRTDFDGLAAMVAAQKLYPAAIMVFPGKLANNVKEFMALYKDRIPVKRPREINKSRVNKVIMVDNNLPTRTGALIDLFEESEVEIIIYDHHQDEQIDDDQIIKSVGATTTILVDKLLAKKIEITPFEATLFALGIYEDTGGLIYKNTTSLDAQVVASLLESRANLEIVEEYIDHSLDRKQQKLFNKLLDSLHQISVKGLKIDTFQAEAKEYIPDISLLTHKLNDLHNCDALFVLVKFTNSNKILVIGRSKSDNINVAQILNYFGGGGHNRAASVTIECEESAELLEWEQEVLKVAREKISPSILVKDIMSTPVKTITADTTMKEADKIMLRNNWSGLVVCKDDELVGIISKRDIDKVRNYDLLHAPVKGYMSTNVITINPDASLKEVQEQIVEHDIGRLPVVNKEDDLVGIITRNDLLKLFYGTDDYLKNRQNLYGRSLVQVQEKRYDVTEELQIVDQSIIDLLKKAGRLADELGYNLYIVGGFVRDLLLERINLDLDLVVEGEGIEFAKTLAHKLNGDLDIYRDFGTAVVDLDNVKLDIATTRIEYYPYTASLPEVEPGSIQQDLFRRDFTINALAIQLNPTAFGQLVDYFNGKKDLEAGVIHLLHNFSLYDDPTRIFRAFRFASRYGYQFYEETERLIKQAIDLDTIEKLSPNRLFGKLKHGLQDENPTSFIRLLVKYDILVYFSDSLVWNQVKEKLVKQVDKIIGWAMKKEQNIEFTPWILYLMTLLEHFTKEEVEKFSKKFNLNSQLKSRIKTSLEIEQIITKLKQAERNSEVYYTLEGLKIEELLFILVKDFSLTEKISLFLEELKEVEIKVSGKDIIDLGYQPGPYFKQILKEVKRAKLDGKIDSTPEEHQFLEKCLQRR